MLFRGFLFSKHSSRLMIWECFSIVSNVIRFNYGYTTHTIHSNMVFSTHYMYLCTALITCIAISDQYATFFLIYSQNDRRRPFWMTKNHFRSHFSPFQINTQLFCHAQFLPKSVGTSRYSRSVATSNMKLIGAFLIKLWSAQALSSYFWQIFSQIIGHFGFPIFSKIDRVLPLYVINGCVKY